jgi:hypothetical protein
MHSVVVVLGSLVAASRIPRHLLLHGLPHLPKWRQFPAADSLRGVWLVTICFLASPENFKSPKMYKRECLFLASNTRLTLGQEKLDRADARDGWRERAMGKYGGKKLLTSR